MVSGLLLVFGVVMVVLVVVEEEFGGLCDAGGLSRRCSRFLSFLLCLPWLDEESFFGLDDVWLRIMDIESESDGMPKDEEQGCGDGGPVWKRRLFEEFPLLCASSSISRLLLSSLLSEEGK